LFLGLSDGARTDAFRRANSHLSYEQVRLTHELDDDRVANLISDLRKDLANLQSDQDTFNTVVLLDDFSASGLSYFRETESGEKKGKIAKFLKSITGGKAYSRLVDKDSHIVVALYMATIAAEQYLREACEKAFGMAGLRSSVVVAQSFPENVRIVPGANTELDAIIDEYYDSTNESSSTALGGSDLRYGFAKCGLPLVLTHNAPNNSIGLLWADGPRMRSLFPRVTRHKDAV
jgi:hypothetical protein